MYSKAYLRAALIAPLLFLAACATNVAERQSLPSERLQVAGISIEGSLKSNATENHVRALETAVRQEITARNAAGKMVDLKLIITRAEFVSQGTRALAGMLAGANHLDITVFLLEPGTTNAIGEFVVNVENNPGGFGIFSDPVISATNDAAKAIADKVLPNG